MIGRLYKRIYKIRTLKQLFIFHKLIKKLSQNGHITEIEECRLNSYASGFEFAIEVSKSGVFDEL